MQALTYFVGQVSTEVPQPRVEKARDVDSDDELISESENGDSDDGSDGESDGR